MVILICVVAGIGFGVWLPGFSVSSVIISDIYVELLKMLTVPFMISSIIYSMNRLIKGGGVAGVIGKVVALICIAMVGAAVLGIVATQLIGPGRGLSHETLTMFSNLLGQNIDRRDLEMPLFTSLPISSTMSFRDTILGLLPANIFAALNNGEALKILVFSILFGIVIGSMKSEMSAPLADAFSSVFTLCMKLTTWLNVFVPLVLVAMVANQVATSGIAPLRAMLGFLITLASVGLVIIFISFLLLRWSTGLSLSEVLLSQRESMTIAIATRNSLACIPVMIEALVERLGFSKERVELLVPIGITLLRIGPVFHYAIATIFIAQMFGKELQLTDFFIIAIGSVLTGLASSGMSGIATISMTGIVCAFVGIPFSTLIVLFAAIDPLSNAIRIVASVVGTNAFAAMACTSKTGAAAIASTTGIPDIKIIS